MKNTSKFRSSKRLMDVAYSVIWGTVWRALRETKTWDVVIRGPEYKFERVPQTTFQYDFGTAECFMRSSEVGADWVPIGKVESVTWKGER